jgi:hypothetical protein
MKKVMSKREFLSTSLGAGLGLGAGYVLGSGQEEAIAQSAQRTARPRGVGANVPGRQIRTTMLFKSPDSFPNGLDVDPDGRGLWIAQQKMTGQNAVTYGVPEPEDHSEAAWLMDWDGNLLHTVITESRNTSGMGVGGGYVWMVANQVPNGVFQTDMNSRLVSHRQVPLGGGGNHGATYRDGKLWINSTRMRGVLRVDPVTWEPEFVQPVTNWDDTHDIAFDDEGYLWIVTRTRYTDQIDSHRAGLAKYDITNGRLLEYSEFPTQFPDPHGLTYHEGAFYACDAGIHPGWPANHSSYSGQTFRIDFV